MIGNVWEWCEDLYNVGCSDRVYRGGSWSDIFGGCSARAWSHDDPDTRYDILGFRLVASTKDQADMDAAEKAAAEEAARKDRAEKAAAEKARKDRAAKEAGLRLIKEMIAIPNKRFKIGKYEVTQAQWQAIMGNNPSHYTNADNPVENVSWDDCKEFIEKLNALPEVKASGLTFRLPTEAEW